MGPAAGPQEPLGLVGPSDPVPFQSQQTMLQFMRAMHGLSKLTARRVATAFDLSRFTSACDLGGA